MASSASFASEDDTAVVASGELCATLPTDAAACCCAASAFFLRSTYALRLSFFLTGCGGLGAAAVGDARGRLPGTLGVSGDCSIVGDVPAVAGDGIARASPEVATDIAVTGFESALGVAGGGMDGVSVWVGD